MRSLYPGIIDFGPNISTEEALSPEYTLYSWKRLHASIQTFARLALEQHKTRVSLRMLPRLSCCTDLCIPPRSPRRT